ncbi:hypothetical protein QFC20_006730 [Naganishia adeliensis]|uniref:Uncharacterized protein n=1 Tax=Naganishia adeliensis TaxID=92952 RepID=A0ACC2V8G5_9TREE|nr:hypothetical protein QFC20_006730 [Naganishia adeliensis]
MDRNDIPALKAQVKNVVRQADARGDIDAGRFTLKVAKKEIAKALGIDAEVLNQKQWKQMVKDLVFKAVENIETLKSSPVKPSSPKKTEEFIRDLLSDEERADKRKGMASSSRKRHESEEESDASPRPSARKKMKVVSESESEENTKPKKSVKRKEELSGKGKKKMKPVSATTISDSDEAMSDVKPKKIVNKKDEGNGKGKKQRPVKVISDSDEDTSDVKPKKSVKKKDEANGKGQKKAKSTASASSSTAPVVEDERVKELKSIVVACGVRKQWKKEFQDMNTPEEQISHLKRLLTSLGMKGQPTKAKAKVIKEKRELAAELGDVLEFEAKRGLGITRSSRSNGNDNGHAEEELAESPIKPRKARASAARNKVASKAYVGSDESSEVDSQDEASPAEDGQSGSGSQSATDPGSDSEVDQKQTTTNGKQARRKMVPSSEDPDTE